MTHLRMRDLIEATGVTDRIVRQYIQRGVLPHATGRGTGPVYTEDHLIRLRAIRNLLSRRYSIDEIKRYLSQLSPEELARLGGAPAPIARPAMPSAPVDSPEPRANPSAEKWMRVVLVPGLELHVRNDAGPLVHRLADEIYAHYSAANP